MKRYDFAKEFSDVPGPREKKLGPYSGEEFREDVLRRWFEEDEPVEIDVSGTIMNFGPSFLSEAFGKIAKELNSKEKFFSIIHVKNDGNTRNEKFKKALDKYVDIALSK